MSRPFIVVGDRINHGGAVVTGSPATDINGKAVARVGDRVVCSKHGQTVIVSGDGTIIIDGNPVARHGDKTACGATLLSSQIAVFVDPGGGSGGSRQSASAGVAAAAAAASAVAVAKYDQAILFVNDEGRPIRDVNYTLTLADGQTFSGVTNASGVTQRVATETEQQIVKAELSADGAGAPCCAKTASSQNTLAVDLQREGVSTTSTEIGTSVQKVKAKGHQRPLTEGELAIARMVFGDSIDYSDVKIHNHGYPFFFGRQDKYTAVTPNGEMYMPPDIYMDDYSKTAKGQALFVHEMTHVWQHQLGYTVRTHGLIVTSRGPSAYVYAIKLGDELSDFNLEQQGDIISDYYMIVLKNDYYDADGSKGAPEDLKAVLAKFLKDPSSRDNLPKG